MEHITLLIGIVIITALLFDFTNGFHDTANAMATTISTGALAPRIAVAMSAVLNLAGAFISVEVAKTISNGIVNDAGIRPEAIFAALIGAIVWNLVTWLLGLPSSSSHALMGGLIGATVASAGFAGVNGGTIVMKVVIPAVAAPFVAGVAAWAATRLTYVVSRNADEQQTAKGYRAGQIVSAALVSLAHGTNDAQKTMGVITLALVSGGALSSGANPPLWVICASGLAIALGTYWGGWRIIRTLGKGITDIKPPQGFAAQTGAAATILASSHLGFSLSTTHVCTGAVMGGGLGRKGGFIRWSTAGQMVVGWALTLPAAGLVAAAASYAAKKGGNPGVIADGVVAVLIAAVILVLARRKPVTADNVNDIESESVVTGALRTVTPPPAGSAAAGTEATGVPEQRAPVEATASDDENAPKAPAGS